MEKQDIILGAGAVTIVLFALSASREKIKPMAAAGVAISTLGLLTALARPGTASVTSTLNSVGQIVGNLK